MNRKLLFLVLVVLGFVMIVVIKYVIRSSYVECNEFIIFVLGVAPNFLLGIIFPLLLKLLRPSLRLRRIMIISLVLIVFMEYDLFN